MIEELLPSRAFVTIKLLPEGGAAQVTDRLYAVP
jgi:hypothetical protein